MRDLPFISVIIPVLNNGSGVNRALEGISRQTWPTDRIEVVVVDNGSEKPIFLQNRYPFQVHVIGCETPGSYAARNVGAAAAKGSVFGFTDADCTPHEQWIEKGVASLGDGNGSQVVGGNVIFTPQNSLSGVALYQVAMGFGQETNIRDKGFAATANLFCTKTQFEKVGPFDERLFSGGDREWGWRASKHGMAIKYQPDAVVFTEPRQTLRDAIRQARRVLAGRIRIRELGLAHLGATAVAKKRSSLESAARILLDQRLSTWDRVRILNAATLIRAAVAWEGLRLAFGTQAERR